MQGAEEILFFSLQNPRELEMPQLLHYAQLILNSF